MTASRSVEKFKLKDDGVEYAHFEMGKSGDATCLLDVMNLDKSFTTNIVVDEAGTTRDVNFKSPAHYLYAQQFKVDSPEWKRICDASTPQDAAKIYQELKPGVSNTVLGNGMQKLFQICEQKIPGFSEALAETGNAYIYPESNDHSATAKSSAEFLGEQLMYYRWKKTQPDLENVNDLMVDKFNEMKAEVIDKPKEKVNQERKEADQKLGEDNTKDLSLKEIRSQLAASTSTPTPTPLSKLPSVEIAGQRVAPFKNPDAKPYGGFANTTKANVYPVKQTVTVHGQELSFKWPSSEHAYHAQKLINLKGRLPKDDPEQTVLTNALRQLERTKAEPGQEFLPRDDFDPIVDRIVQAAPRLGEPGTDDKSKRDAFNKQCVGGDFGLQEKFMRDVIKLKLEQNPELKELAMQMAREGVIPVEYSQYDSKWASGKDGDGKNLLGIMILEEGNRLLRENGETPKIENPSAAYQAMQTTDKDALKHDNLHSASSVMKPPKPSTTTKPKSTTGAGTTPDTGSDLATARLELDGLKKAAKTASDKAAELERNVATLTKSAEEANTKADDLSGVATRKGEEHAALVTAQQEAEGLFGSKQQNTRDVDSQLTLATNRQAEFKRINDDFKTKDQERIRLQEVRNDAERALSSETSEDKRGPLKATFDAANKAYQDYIAAGGEYANAKDAVDKFDPPKKSSVVEAELNGTVERLTQEKAIAVEAEKLAENALTEAKGKVVTSQTELTQAQSAANQARIDADSLKEPLKQATQEAKAAKEAATTAAQKVVAQEKVVEKAEAKATSSSPEDDAKKEEEEKKEAAKKQAEQKKRETERENAKKMQFAELYSNKRGWPRQQWENLYDPNSNKKDTDKDTPRLSSGSGDNDFETKPGRYRHPKHGDKFDILYGEDGSVKPIPPSKFGVWNKEGYSASMDFIAGKLGASTVKISLPMATDERLKSHNKKQLRELLQMAHKKGLSVEFDQSTMEFLNTLSTKDFDRFMRAKDLLAQNAMKNDMLVGAGDDKELNNAKIKAGEGILGDKKTEAEYTKSKLDGKTTIDDKLSVVDAELDKLDKHASDMRDLNQRMQSLSKAAEGLLSKPDNLADLHREQIYRTKWQRFKDLIRPNVRENAKRYEDYSQGIADIESKFEKEKAKRGNLVESIDKKLDKLESLRAEWKKELDKLKADNSGKPDSDPGKKKLEDKIKKLEKKLDDIDGKLKEGKKEVADIKKNEKDFKDKIVAAKENAEKYKASKQAKISNS